MRGKTFQIVLHKNVEEKKYILPLSACFDSWEQWC